MTRLIRDAVQSLEQLRLVWRLCVEDRGTGEVDDRDGLAIRWADNAFPFWNTLANTEVGATAGSTKVMLQEAARYMRSQQHPGFLWLFEDLLAPDAQTSMPAAAEQAGLELALSGFGMAGDILPLTDMPRHPDLEFVRVRTDADITAYAALNCHAYGFAPESVEAGFSGSRLWKEKIHAWLGLRNGVPVTAGGTIAVDDCLFVILIATAPGHERRGYGEAITRKALYEGGQATGLRRATLHATQAGAPVYERIGFRKVGSIGFYGLRT